MKTNTSAIITAIVGLNVTLWLGGCSQFMLDDNRSLRGHVYINEVSADNLAQSDWIEFYNSSNEPVELSGFHVSDTNTNLAKWTFPDRTYIDGKSFYVLVCDGIEDNGTADFRLNAGVDQIFLTDPSGEVVDSLNNVPETNSGAYHRVVDGGLPFEMIATPSRGASNQ